MKRKKLKDLLNRIESLANRPRPEIPDSILRQELDELRQTITGEPEYGVPLREHGHVSWVPAAIDIIERYRKELQELRRELGEFRSRHRASACGMSRK